MSIRRALDTEDVTTGDVGVTLGGAQGGVAEAASLLIVN
jgi:hypothetical protein